MKSIIKTYSTIFLFLLTVACGKKNEPTPATTLYFPTLSASTWESVTPASLGWNSSAIADLQSYLSSTGTRAFIILKDGKIVMEQYTGEEINNTNKFSVTSQWYWASAGKTLTSALVGIASDQGKINIGAKTSDYLGVGWSSLTADQESKITVLNHLTMTTGLDDYSEPGSTGDTDCTDPSCLIYKAAAGTRWAYHNAAYTLLDSMLHSATGQTVNSYISTQVLAKTGMDGRYIKSGYNNVFYSTARSMARYGLLLLNQGVWDGTTIIPQSYFTLMKNSSQDFNQSYGYLTWLNGKSSFMVPQSQAVFTGSLTAGAPADMFCAMGKNGQIINVVPSQNLVIIRMGDDTTDTGLVSFTFQNNLWTKINAVIAD